MTEHDFEGLRQTANGVMLAVRAVPGARKNEIKLDARGELRVCVTQTADRGKANDAIVGALAKLLRLPKSRVQIVRGATSRQKLLLLRDCRVEEVRSRLLADA